MTNKGVAHSPSNKQSRHTARAVTKHSPFVTMAAPIGTLFYHPAPGWPGYPVQYYYGWPPMYAPYGAPLLQVPPPRCAQVPPPRCAQVPPPRCAQVAPRSPMSRPASPLEALRCSPPPLLLPTCRDEQVEEAVAEAVAAAEAESVALAKSTPVPRAGCSLCLFVGHLPIWLSEAGLWDYFQRFGVLRDARVALHGETGVSRCFGFVTFVERAGVAAALAAHHTLDGHTLDVQERWGCSHPWRPSARRPRQAVSAGLKP